MKTKKRPSVRLLKLTKMPFEQAAARQHYIDQGQSLNVMVPPDTPVKEY